MNIHVISLNEMPDSRLKELVREQARAVLEAQGIDPTPEAIDDYLDALRDVLEERWVAIEEVPVYAVPH